MMAAQRSCELCGHALIDRATLPGYQEPLIYAILDCQNCCTMVADPKLTDERVYNAIYAVPGGPPGYDRNFQYARRVLRRSNPLQYLTSRQDAFWGVAEALRRTKAHRVLEVGCGLGYFTYALRKAGYDAIGIDLSAEAVAKASSAYGSFYEARSLESYTASEAGGKFDAVVMVEVVEHLEDPMHLLAESLRLLAPGGSLIISTPNRSFFEPDVCWATDLPPVHLWWFSEPSMKHIAERLGATLAFIDFTQYNRHYPVLRAYQTPQTPVLSSSGAVIRREALYISLARRLGVLQDLYRVGSIIASTFRTRHSMRRPTMVAQFQHLNH